MTFIAEPTHLVVGLPHLGPVLDVLDEVGKRKRLYGRPETSDVLDLALVPLIDPVRVARKLEAWPSAEPRPGHQPPGPDAPPLDRILWRLRAGFERRYLGWTPLLGKNRTVGQVHGAKKPSSGVSGAGEVSHGGGGAPEAITKPDWAVRRAEVEPNGVTVGLVDTAMVDHEYLTGAWTGPYRDASSGGTVHAEDGHATFIAGLIRRHAPAATLRVYPVLDGSGDASAWDTAHRIVEAGRSGVDVLNLSFVCYTEDGHPPLVLTAALERLGGSTVVVAAAGNHGFLGNGLEFKPAYPAALPNVIAVGAKDAPFSGQGPWITVEAEGTALESTFLSGMVSVWKDPDGKGRAPARRHDREFQGYARWSGTSFAAAVVSAMIARVIVSGRKNAVEVSAELLWTSMSGVRSGF